MSRDLILLAFSQLTWGAGESMFLYFQPLYLQELGANPVKIGFILGIAAVASVFVHIPAGYLADRVGRRPVMWASWFIAMVATWTMALAKSLPVFVVGMVIYGCTYFAMAPINSYITAGRGNWSVGRALSLQMAAFNSGSILGPMIGGLVADRVGLHAIYFISGSIFIVSTCFILNIRPQPIEPHLVEQPGRRQVFNPRLLAFLSVLLFAVFAAYLPQPLSSNFLQNVRSLSYGQIGQLGSISSLGMVLMSLMFGHINIHLGFAISQAAVGLFTLLLWQGHSFVAFTAGYLFLGGFRLAHTFASAQTNELVHQSRMGLAYGLTETVFSIGTVLAPPLAGYLYALKPGLPYSVSFVLILLSLGLVAGYYYWPRSRTVMLGKQNV